jgi:hypothetical protein
MVFGDFNFHHGLLGSFLSENLPKTMADWMRRFIKDAFPAASKESEIHLPIIKRRWRTIGIELSICPLLATSGSISVKPMSRKLRKG